MDELNCGAMDNFGCAGNKALLPESRLTMLLTTHILRYMPTPVYYAYVCSAGSQGYHALKEMLMSGVPGNTLLLESVDLRDVNECSGADDVKNACMIYKHSDEDVDVEDYEDAYEGNVYRYPDLHHVAVYTDMCSIPDLLLARCKLLQTIDLSALSPHVTAIGAGFLEECSSLKTIDLAPLSQVASVGYAFLSQCSSLSSIDLTPLSGVTSKLVEGYFLSECNRLACIDLAPLANIEVIEDCFLLECSTLTSIDLSPLSSVTSIGKYFLSGCSGLTNIDLSPLSGVTTLPWAFMRGCTGLTSVDLNPLSRVTTIRGWLLATCDTSLKRLDMSGLICLGAVPPGLLDKFGASAQSIVLLPTHLMRAVNEEEE